MLFFFLDMIVMNEIMENNYGVNVLWKENIACMCLLENDLISTIAVTPILVDHETGCVRKVMSYMKNVQIRGRTCHVHQFEGMVVLNSELETNMGSN
jgi:hypothetical protein